MRPPHRTHPSHEVVLEARRRRRFHVRLATFSVLWTAGIALFLAASGRSESALEEPSAHVVLMFLPAVALGVWAGPRTWPAQLGAGLIAIVFGALVHSLLLVPLVAALVALIGYGSHLVASLVTGSPWRRGFERGPDEPRDDIGGSSSGADDRPGLKRTLVRVAPSDRVYRKRLWH